MVFPWITFGRKDKKLSNIEYLAIQEFNGNLTTGKGTLSATGDLVKIIAGSGDMYLARASIIVRTEGIQNTFGTTVILETGADGAESTVDSAAIEVTGTATTAGGGNSTVSYQFAYGFKVTTGQVIQLRVTVMDAGVEVSGSLECIEVATGVSPAV